MEKNIIEEAWTASHLTPLHQQAIHRVLSQLNQGLLRVCEKKNDTWVVHAWIKKAILLFFKIQSLQKIEDAWDKIPLKTSSWTEKNFSDAGFRSVPGARIRYGAFIEKDAVLMPSFINIGAFVGHHTMVDTWATIGSCAQIGAHCHISGGVGIGGVLEPLQTTPVIIEDNCFIGARSEIAEGVLVEEGAVISMGVFISASTKIIDRETGKIYQGRVPAYAVVVPGSIPSKNNVNLSCAVIVKRVDEQTRKKTAINEILRSS